MYCYEHPSIPYDGFYAAIEMFKKTGGFAWKCGDNWILCVVEREGDLLRTNGILNALSDMLSQVDEKPSDISGYSIMRLNGRTIDWEAIVSFVNEEFGKKCLPIRVTTP